MPYEKQTWLDSPNISTPVSAARLSHMEDGIEAGGAAADRITKDQVANVLSLGAVNDGVTDNTAVIQSAVDTYPTVYFPPGVYVTGQISPPNGTRLIGANPASYSFPPPSTRCSWLKLKDGTNASLIRGASGIANVRLERLAFDGNKTNNSSGHVVEMVDTAAQDTDWRIIDCYIHNSPVDGIHIGVGRQACRIERVMVQSSGQHGMNLRGADTVVHGCLIGNSTMDGIYVDSTGSPGSWVIRIESTDIWNNRVGINLQGPHMVTIVGAGIDRNMQHGIYVGANCQGVSLFGCHMHMNSRQTNAGYSHITMVSTGQLAVVGCQFEHEDAVTYPNKPAWAIDAQAGTTWQFGNLLDASATTNGASGLISDQTKLVGDLHGPLAHKGATAGFYGTAAVAKPTVTGSRAGNAALTSLLTALASQGLITNSSSA